MAVITLQPSSGFDTHIIHYAGTSDDTNYSTEALLVQQSYAANQFKRILLKFDISAIPSNSTILGGTIGLNFQGGAAPTGNVVIEAHEISRSWVTSAVTYNKYDGTNNWSTPGGDFGTTVISSVTSDNTPASYTWDITPSIIQGWFSTNNGIILKGENEAMTINDKYFDSSRGTTANLRPYLTISYDIGGASRKLLGVGA